MDQEIDRVSNLREQVCTGQNERHDDHPDQSGEDRTSRQAGYDESVPERVAIAARCMIEHLEAKIVKIDRERGRKVRYRDTYAGMAKNARTDEERARAQEIIDDEQPEYEKAIAAFDAHEAALRSKIERLRMDPLTMYLPIGTVVRFTATPSHVDSLSILQENGDDDYPSAGTVGVVTGLNHKSDYPIRVSVRRPFKTGYGDALEPDYDRYPTYYVDPEKIEVVEPGMLPGGRPCQSYGYVATHACKDPDEDDETEMIVEADGFFWRLYDFGGTQGIEALQAYERMEEMSWVGEAIEADEEQAPAP